MINVYIGALFSSAHLVWEGLSIEGAYASSARIRLDLVHRMIESVGIKGACISSVRIGLGGCPFLSEGLVRGRGEGILSLQQMASISYIV